MPFEMCRQSKKGSFENNDRNRMLRKLNSIRFASIRSQFRWKHCRRYFSRPSVALLLPESCSRSDRKRPQSGTSSRESIQDQISNDDDEILYSFDNFMGFSLVVYTKSVCDDDGSRLISRRNSGGRILYLPFRYI